ncbi:MAG TPA: nucleotidyltransferase domain-containing protein [Verrucomicrobiae bacterium]
MNIPLDKTSLSPAMEQLLTDLVTAARGCFQDNLKSVVLFGSGAEGRLRATSDLNLLFVLTAFDAAQANGFREPMRVAQVAGRATGMFVLASELPAVAEAFAVKFDDIARRHRVLFGDDLVANLPSSRAAKKQRLRQVLLNLLLRLRERYVSVSLHEEHLAIVIAETAGPLRSAAATLRELEGAPADSPKAALEQLAQALNNPDWLAAVTQIHTVRESRSLPPGEAPRLMFQLTALTEAMLSRTEKVN